MAEPKIDAVGRMVVTDMVTGEVFHWPPPTALENVARNPERYVHGETSKRVDAPVEPTLVEEPPPALRQEDVLDLPPGETGISGPAVDQVEGAPAETQAAEADADADGHGDDTGRFVAPRPALRQRRAGKKK